ncbi:hypothetical protein ACTA71_010100 [Dictyostelium dimigraforme]
MDKENFFDKNVYNYTKKSQTSRIVFYISTIIILGVMIANELDFVYNSFQFTVIGCSNVSSIQSYDSYEISTFSTVNETQYTFEKCIESGIQICIPELYVTTSNTSLSFSIPLFLSNNSPLAKFYQGDIYFIYYMLFIFILIILFFFYVERTLYVSRSRAHLLLCMNILLLKDKKWHSFIIVVGASVLVLGYSFLKYIMISGIQKSASILICNQIPISLFFEGKSQASLVGIAFNFILFLFIFKDPILELYNNLNEYYEELSLIKLIQSKNAQNTLERMKLIKCCKSGTIYKAVVKFVENKYPIGTISRFERYKRNHIFEWFNTTKVDFIPAVLEYYQDNPHLFTPVISNQIDFESNGKDDDDDNNEKKKLIN